MNPIMQLMSGGRPSSPFDITLALCANYKPQSVDELLAVIDRVFARVGEENKAARDFHLQNTKTRQDAAERMAAMMDGENPKLKDLEAAAASDRAKTERLENVLTALRAEFPERVDELLATKAKSVDA
jgi:YesN/AraC family two-component response regulator